MKNQCKYGCDLSDQQTLADIRKYGFHMVSVFDGQPPFVYSIGVEQTTGGRAECIVVGQREQVAAFIIAEYYNRIKAGKTLELNHPYSGFIDGFEVRFEAVHPSNYDAYLGLGIRHYKSLPFKVVQAIYPTKHGLWPWDANAGLDFKLWQPRLSIPKEE